MPILGLDGLLIIAEPPDEHDRWTDAVGATAIARMPWRDRRVALLRRVSRRTL
jgi:hypothetical protein